MGGIDILQRRRQQSRARQCDRQAPSLVRPGQTEKYQHSAADGRNGGDCEGCSDDIVGLNDRSEHSSSLYLRSDMRRAPVKGDHRQNQETEDELLPLIFETDADQERAENLQHEDTDDREAIATIAARQRCAADHHRSKRGEQVRISDADESTATPASSSAPVSAAKPPLKV